MGWDGNGEERGGGMGRRREGDGGGAAHIRGPKSSCIRPPITSSTGLVCIM